jgi:2'-hydroxyisoflavone reductase
LSVFTAFKARAEQEVAMQYPGMNTVIRPCLIVGPLDRTDRFTYWPARIDKGGEVLAPGNPSDPVQFIDGRDLAEWTIRMVENGETGIYNATGPAKELGIGGMLDGIKSALNSNATFTWADAEFLKQQKVEAWSDMPVWAGDELGLSRTNISRALAKGLTFRPVADNARDALTWFKAQKPERQAKLRAGLTAEREAGVLAALHKSKMTKSE